MSGVTVQDLLDSFEKARADNLAAKFRAAFAAHDPAATVEAVSTGNELLLVVTPPEAQP